jgi:hypothetical protein
MALHLDSRTQFNHSGHLRLDYGLLDVSQISQPDGKPLAVLNALTTLHALEYLYVQYDAFFGSGDFASSWKKELNTNFLPQSVRTLYLNCCPSADSMSEELNLILCYAQSRLNLVNVIIEWFLKSG